MWSPHDLLSRLLGALDRRRNAAALVGSAALSLWLYAHGGALGRPLRGAVDVVLGPLHAVTSTAISLLNVWVWKENQDLQARLLTERLDRMALEELKLENARLRALLEFPAPFGFRTVPCSIVSYDEEPLGASVTVDRGRSTGLKGGEAVVSMDGLVGRVAEVYPSRARVLLVSNYEAPVAVRVQQSRVLGVVEWDPLSARMHMKNVPATEQVAEGDTLISSGMGGIYPEGLYVGRVESVRLDPMGLVQEIVVAPGARFNRLEELFLLIPLGS